MRHDLIRNLGHFRRTSLALVAGAAVAASVVAGALLVGDSVRGSLRALTEERLGEIDYALAGQRFFDRQPSEEQGRAAAILLQGSAQNAESRARASRVGIYGVDQAFFDLYAGHAGPNPFAGASGLFPPVLVNAALADALGVAPGDAVLLSLRRIHEVPDGSLLARDDTASVIGTIRLTVLNILPDAGLGAFQLGAHQGQVFNAFLPLEAAQRALEQQGKVNALLVAEPAGRGASLDDQRQRAGALTAELDQRLDLGDLAIELVDEGATFKVQSGEYVLRPVLAEAVATVAQRLGARPLPFLTYLINDFQLGDRHVPYSTATALPFDGRPAEAGALVATAPPALPAIGPGRILLGAWLAERLAAKPGDRLRIRYFEVGDREELKEVERELEVAGVVAMEGLATDAGLTQEYPGIAGSDDMSDWDPPFPIDLKRISPADEAYWDRWRGAPKAFVDLEQGQSLWGNRWGNVSGVRIVPPAGETAAAFLPRFGEALRAELKASSFGLQFEPVRALGLQAAGGATDFGGLFFGLSFFVIAAAGLLVALLMSLMIEQRAGEIGLRQALGFSPRRVRRQLLAEGLVLAGAGVLAGLAGAVAYAAAMMWGLRTIWRPAVGTSRLELFVTPQALLGGAAIALVVTGLVILGSLRRVGRLPVPQLLRRNVEAPLSRGGRLGRAAAWILSGLALVLGGVAVAGKPALFPLAGLCLLGGGLAAAGRLIDRDRSASLARAGGAALLGMALTNTRRRRRRSLLALTLVALATFLVVMVAAFEVDFSQQSLGKDSGTGGFAVTAEAANPLQADLATPGGRAELGLDEAVFANAAIWPLRLLPGDDTSCLNLYQPSQPRLLGLPAAFRERGGFTFQQVSQEIADPWQLLDAELGDDVVPVIGDFNSTQWILKLPLGGELTIKNEAGRPIRLRLMASLATSIFQSELLVSEEQFLRHFPSRGGYSVFLVEGGGPEQVIPALESGLDRYGLDAEKTADQLAAFHAVQNTYLSTFRSLGGLGLLLGTLGLATVLVRNVLERRGELAALRAFGFRRKRLVHLVLWENVALLVGGLAIGTVSALLAAGANWLAHPADAPWSAILVTLLAIAAFGIAACWAAALGALAAPLVPALKSE